MIDSIALGDKVSVVGTVVSIMNGQVVIDIDGESVVVKPALLTRPAGGKFAQAGARRKGREARLAGKPIADCPYGEDEKRAPYRNSWIKGWMEGEQ